MVAGDVYRRLVRDGAAFADRVRLVTADDDAGIGVEQLLEEPDLVRQLIEGQGRRLEAAYGTRFPTYMLATRVLHDYAWPVCLVVSAPWFLEGVVPVPGPGDVRVEPESGRLLVRPVDTAEPGDAEAVRRVVTEHHRPLVEALNPHLRRGTRGTWGTIADDLVSGVWWIGRLLDDERAAVAAASALLPAPSALLPGSADFREIEDAVGRTHLTRTRVACCLRYVAEPDACLTCPRVGDTERRERLALT